MQLRFDYILKRRSFSTTYIRRSDRSSKVMMSAQELLIFAHITCVKTICALFKPYFELLEKISSREQKFLKGSLAPVLPRFPPEMIFFTWSCTATCQQTINDIIRYFVLMKKGLDCSKID